MGTPDPYSPLQPGELKESTVAIPAIATTAAPAIAVTADNFCRAETDRVLAGFCPHAFGRFQHIRELTPLDSQHVQRQNRDTLYSPGVFDLDAGPVTISLPDAGRRFMSLTVFNEDHYTRGSEYGAGDHFVNRERVGTRYTLVALRTLVDPHDPRDVAQAHALQDAVVVHQRSRGRFEIPNWDEVSQRKVRDALTVLGATLPDLNGAAGLPGQVDPVRHLIVTATGWGLNPPKDAVYLNVTPSRNDGTTVHSLTVPAAVPVDGFWSISLYNAAGYFQKNDQGAYTINNLTAKKDPDGSVSVQFGGCDGRTPNCLPIMEGWNYMVRLYRPRPEILNGTWTFPEARPGAARGQRT
jgi:hypothetical protein